MRPIVNPFMPTPLGMGYKLMNPFDDCEQKTGTMVDYKHRYWHLLTNLKIQKFIIDQLWDAALRQVQAAGDRPICWYFAEKKTADFVRDLFDRDPGGRGNIKIIYAPMPGTDNE